MSFTRDSAVWWLLLLVAGAGYLSSHFNLITSSFPAVNAVWESRLELVSAVGGVVAGYLRMSPLALSPDSALAVGRADPDKTLSITGKP